MKKPISVITHSIRSIVQCDFDDDNILPEFRGRHPAIVISTRNRKGLPYLIVPTTSKMPFSHIEYCHRLEIDIIHNTKDTWVICSHIYAVSSERIHGYRHPKRVAPSDFSEIEKLLHKRLPQIARNP